LPVYRTYKQYDQLSQQQLSFLLIYAADVNGQGVVDSCPTQVRLDTKPTSKLQYRHEEVRVSCQRLQKCKSTTSKK